MVEQQSQPLVSLADAERRAVSLLPPMVIGYYASGAEDETTLAAANSLGRLVDAAAFGRGSDATPMRLAFGAEATAAARGAAQRALIEACI